MTKVLDTTFTTNDTIYYEEEIKFESDGKYSKTYILSDLTNTIFTDGNWIFLGKSELDDLKNKEAILLTTTALTQTDGTTTTIDNYSNLDGETSVINQLKNKELILTVNRSSRSDDGLRITDTSIKTTYEAK